jgi:hypothetical protein
MPMSPGMQQLGKLPQPPMSPGMNALQKLPGAPPMPGQGLGGIASSIQRLPGFGGGTGISSGQQGDMPWQSTGKPADQEAEAQRLLGYGPGKPWEVPAQQAQAAQMPASAQQAAISSLMGGGNPQLNALAQQMPAGAGGAPASLDWMNKAQQSAPNPMLKPGMQNQMAQMLGSAPPMPMPAPAAAMGEPTSFAKSGGGGGKGKAAGKGGGGQGRR